MSNDFTAKMLPLISRIEKFAHPDFTPYIHCSKINSVLQVLKEIPPFLQQLETTEPRFTMKQFSAVAAIHSILDQLNDLFRSCRRETCVQFVLATPVTGPRYEIASLRDAAASAFGQLEMGQVADRFRISEQELAGQDMVDMNRIAKILIQISLRKREDTEEDLRQRFDSLRRMGLDVSGDDTESVTIPELPENLRLVVRHCDVSVGSVIGKGQAGIVKVGSMVGTGEMVAVKILYRRALTKPELESFRREIFTMSVLSHPALLKFKGYTEEAPFYLITEYMRNGSLFDVLKKRPETLTPTDRTLIALDVARGLEYLHSKGVIHRDLKSLNVLLDENNKAKICDFGMVRTMNEGPKTGMIGTVHWMAPEVLMSSPDYDQKVDVYSYGIFLWELLTGDMLYKDMTQSEITMGVTMHDLRPPLPDDCPQRLKELIQSCWSKDPAARPKMSRVVAKFSCSKYHFPGTDQAVFQSQAGILGKHRSTNSQIGREHKRRHRRAREHSSGAISEIQNPQKLIEELEKSTGYVRAGYARMLSQMLLTANATDRLVEAGGCRVIVDLLQEQSDSSSHVLSQMGNCKSASIFDVDVLKALLAYSSTSDDKRRQQALWALLCAVRLRFEFIASALSFVAQILQYLMKPLETDAATELLQVTKLLFSRLHQMPEGVLATLIYFWNDKPELREMSTQCILEYLKHAPADSWREIFGNQNLLKALVDEHCHAEQSSPFDRTIVLALYSQRSHTYSLELLVQMAQTPKFAEIIVGLLPTGEDTRVAASLYLPLLDNPSFYPTLSQIPEFYAVASYFVVSGKCETICGVLKRCEIRPVVLQTKLCSLLAQSLQSATDDSQRISIMSAVFSISNTVESPEFIDLIPLLLEFLFSDKKQLRMPSFLCIAALTKYTTENIKFHKFLPIAAFYVNSDSSLVREVAARVLQQHLLDSRVNANQCLKVFLESCDTYDPTNTAIAIAAFRTADKHHPLDQSLITSLASLHP